MFGWWCLPSSGSAWAGSSLCLTLNTILASHLFFQAAKLLVSCKVQIQRRLFWVKSTFQPCHFGECQTPILVILLCWNFSYIRYVSWGKRASEHRAHVCYQLTMPGPVSFNRQETHEFQVSLGLTVSSRLIWIALWESISKNQGLGI